ncbi:MAG: prephenate dehydrogenase [Clostridia bacterium]|nr:prephenate dehydrogenase [Oscillospiraceae bacterium]MBQ7034047.1 prephenate dehydrogenase [Clostridia bacterium]
MQVGIVGLGLIGGSAARAYKEAGHTVLATDRDRVMLDYAILCGAVDGPLATADLAECDLVLLCLYPGAVIEYMEENAAAFPKKGFVIDFCGTKKRVCDAGFALAEKHGFLYVGGHPMAGTHNSGFKYSRSDMFRGAPMVIVPPVYDDMALLDSIKKVLSPLEFGSFSVTDADSHDKRIAFTSQLAHVVSNAYVKSPEAKMHKGLSAGSYKDLTRVAWLNPDMWTELFLENRTHLLEELDGILHHIREYRDALSSEDAEKLWQLLDDGRRIKGEIDG